MTRPFALRVLEDLQSYDKVCFLYFEEHGFLCFENYCTVLQRPNPVTTRSKAWVCGRSLAGNAGSISHGLRYAVVQSDCV